jgi:hypothetical protein
VGAGGPSGKFSVLLLEGLDHYRKGRMLEAVKAWEEAYLLEPTNLRAREFLRSALERIHAHMHPAGSPAAPAVGAAPAAAKEHPWLPKSPPDAAPPQVATSPQAELPQRAKQGAKPGASKPKQKVPVEAPAAAQPQPSPWDDGPSVAIPQAEDPGGGEASSAWGIHKEALPIEAVADDETDVWMRGARELVALNDFSGALELLVKVLGRNPADKETQEMHDLCEQNLTAMFESKIGAMDARPQMAIPPDEVIWLNLDPRAGFVLAQIDGEVSFEDLYAICGLKRLDTARILSQLLEEGVVKVKGQDRAVAKRAMNRS